MVDGIRKVKAVDGKQRRLRKIVTEPDDTNRSLVQALATRGL